MKKDIKFSQIIMLSIVMILIIIAIILVTNNKDEDIQVDDDQMLVEISSDVKSYVGNYGVEIISPNPEDETIYYNYLYLREDGTFLLNTNTFACEAPSVGTYELKGRELILTEKVRYGCDSCFFKRNLRTFNVPILDNNLLTIVENDKKLNYSKGLVDDESAKSKEYYVLNPIDGQKPSSNSETWVECKNGTKK